MEELSRTVGSGNTNHVRAFRPNSHARAEKLRKFLVNALDAITSLLTKVAVGVLG